ncbi:hypothetical protein PM082_001227 [Marasmius tenuissimus]|nr:hypothetical protein PM082_001227 [Marasmius tenuissimus]
MLYGPVGPNAASYAVQVDGGSTSTFSATKARFVPRVMLYYGSNLGPGKHTLKFVCRPSTGQVCSIDYAEVFTTSSIQKRSSGSSTGALSTGAIAGLVIGILLLVALLLFGLFWYFRRRKQERERQNQRDLFSASGLDGSSFRPGSNTYNYGQPVSANAATAQSTYSTSMTLPNPYPVAVYETSTTSPYIIMNQPEPANVTVQQSSASIMTHESGAPLVSPQSTMTRSTSDSGSSSSRSYNGTVIRTIANSTSPRPGPRISSLKGQNPTPLPASVGQSLDSVPEDELRDNRLVVEGRPQDFGSLSQSGGGGSGSNSSHDLENQPPPDYSQATEPYRRPG